ncbi:hypothetical protein M0R45_015937 [Rubus argutus]|uniref:Uncharacterized protein n=1 Tax=Rubus argutus TaxID=59490 RepID=A0AAW1XRP5_RUBAR
MVRMSGVGEARKTRLKEAAREGWMLTGRRGRAPWVDGGVHGSGVADAVGARRGTRDNIDGSSGLEMVVVTEKRLARGQS